MKCTGVTLAFLPEVKRSSSPLPSNTLSSSARLKRGHLYILARTVVRLIGEHVRICENSTRIQALRELARRKRAELRPGATAHVRELEDKRYPYGKLMELFVNMDYSGWVLLEARGKPKDRVAALAQQLKLFNSMVASGQKALGNKDKK